MTPQHSLLQIVMSQEPPLHIATLSVWDEGGCAISLGPASVTPPTQVIRVLMRVIAACARQRRTADSANRHTSLRAAFVPSCLSLAFPFCCRQNATIRHARSDRNVLDSLHFPRRVLGTAEPFPRPTQLLDMKRRATSQAMHERVSR